MACILIGRNPAAYGFKVNPARLPDTEDVLLKGPLDLRIAAECAGCSEQSLREMNPSLRLWCTPKGSKPLPLRIPAGSRDRFLRKLAMVKDWTPARESSIPR
jgi:membrane-bound lytic murein transglycosylase D